MQDRKRDYLIAKYKNKKLHCYDTSGNLIECDIFKAVDLFINNQKLINSLRK